MKKRIISLLTAVAMLLPAAAVTMPQNVMAAGTGTVVRLDPSEASPFNDGEFQGWGTALCWWANRLGYSEKLTQQAADAFYSDEGLSLDIARYNLGGGDDPAHNHITRSDSKVPGVWDTFEPSEDGKDVNITKYDITKDQNQLNIAKAALKANPDLYFEGFSNSAPYFMTVSGCTGGGDPAASDNLKTDMYDDFAKFIADATLLFKENGIVFQSYSPMNEPDTDYWGVNSPKQEGCHFSPGTSQSNMIIETRKALDEAGLNDVLVAGMDETSIDKTVSNLDSLTSDAKTDLGRIDTHTYSGSKRAQLKAKAQSMNKNLWMSEVDKGGDGAVLANMIMTDMNGMQPSAWVMWDIVDCHKDSEFTASDGSHPEASTYKAYTDGLWGVGVADHDNEELYFTNKYYYYGQFTKYIKPGMTIIASSNSTLAAYDKKTGEIVIVALNDTAADKSTTFDLRAFTETGTKAQPIRSDKTSEKWNALEPINVVNKQFDATLKANSITTFVVNSFETGVTKFDTTDENKTSYSYVTAIGDDNYDKYFAVYDNNGVLQEITKNRPNYTFDKNYNGCTFKLLLWDGMTPYKVVNQVAAAGSAVDYMTINGATTVVTGVEYSYTAALGSSEEAPAVTWSVSDETVASVTEDGKVTASKGGSFTLTATMADGKNTAIDITALGTEDNIRIINKNSRLGLETKGKGITSGSQLVQWENRNLDTAAWKLTATTDGHFNITNANADMLLAANADAKPVISDSITDDNAKWDLINHGGYYEIKNIATNKSLNVSGQSKANGGSVILYTFGGGDNELWSFEGVADELEHVIPVPTDYSAKYKDTDYTFVSNIAAATNDFNDSELKGFVTGGVAKTTSDGAGEAVLGVQPNMNNSGSGTGAGSATLTLDPALTCDDNQIINMAFDVFVSNSGGSADVGVFGADDLQLVKLTYTAWDNFKVNVGSTEVDEAGNAASYLRNGVNSGADNQKIENAGHMEIYYKPSTGALKVTLKNNTNSAAMKTYEGTVAANGTIVKLAFNADFTSWTKPMYVDNLVTNIITEK